MAESASTSTSAGFPCSTPGCTRVSPTALSCPTCISLGLSPTKFCSQECFKGYWKEHNIIHKEAKARIEFKPPPFDYTGPLRPHYVTPQRTVPSSINRPDYWATGVPESEMKSKGSNTIYINNKKEIEGIRAACAIGRSALDLAHSMIRPGITTESIDQAVHDYIVSQSAYPSPLNYHGFPKSCCTSVNEIIW
jgi:methionyl aminopeptidase